MHPITTVEAATANGETMLTLPLALVYATQILRDYENNGAACLITSASFDGLMDTVAVSVTMNGNNETLMVWIDIDRTGKEFLAAEFLF